MTRDKPEIVARPRLSQRDRESVDAIESAATEADGVSPLDDQVRMDLLYGAGLHAEHLLAHLGAGRDVLGYAHVTHAADGDDADTAHVVVRPDWRRHHLGTELIEVLLDAAVGSRLRVWAHGDGEPARQLGLHLGFTRVRDLWQMQRSLSDPLDEVATPNGVALRTFVPGRDDSGWVLLNASAFRDHPEQGRLTLDDLHERMAQPWFDPAGFFMAERSGELIGFHWTKVHPASGLEPPIGEVYAVGVDPATQRLGLGRTLTLVGLRHLQEAGLDRVMLYVDGDNKPAIALYRKLGFTRSAVDVMYERSAR
ncbi:MAG: mycothiol synthase [Nocardioidaceae bacterium]